MNCKTWMKVKLLLEVALIISLGSALATAQIIVQYPNETVSGNNQIFFNIDVNPTVFTAGLESQFALAAAEFSLGPEADGITALLSVGTVVGNGTSFEPVSATDVGTDDLINGNNFIGLELKQNDGEHYGYIEITQTQPYYGFPYFDDKIDAIAYNKTANQPLTIEAAPEPSAADLFLSTIGLLGCLLTCFSNKTRGRRAQGQLARSTSFAMS